MANHCAASMCATVYIYMPSSCPDVAAHGQPA
jgi:hypothetical protein